MKPSRVLEALKVCVKSKRPVFLWGPPGVGKSDIVKLLAEDKNDPYRLIDIRAVLYSPVELQGIPTVTEKGKTRWAPPSLLPTGKGKYIIFLDELNAAPPLVQAACYQLVLDRKIGEYVLPENAVVIAAGNRETDRAVTSRMPSPLANRFIHIDFEIDLDDWISWAIPSGIRTEVISFLRFRPELLHQFDAQKNDKAFPTPRSWEFVSQIMDNLAALKGESVNYEDQELFKGIVGPGAASELLGFIKVYRSLPDVEEVIARPKKAKVPSDPATLYAICGALAHKADESNFKNVITYASRLRPEFSVLLIRDTLERSPQLNNSIEFIKWASENADVLT